MKGLISLHEAIMIALINIDKKTFAASFDEIAAFIKKRDLFKEASNCPLPEQIMLRSTKSQGRYHYLFHQIDDNTIQLKGYPLIKERTGRRKVTVNGIDLSDYTKNKMPIATIKKNEKILYKTKPVNRTRL
jgi:hypothetical protein